MTKEPRIRHAKAPAQVRPGEAADSIAGAKGLLFIVFILTAFGLTMLYSTSYGVAGLRFFKSQLLWCLLGSIAAVTVYFIGYRKIADFSLVWLILSLILLVVALFFPAVNGAHRWIRLGSMSMQPSEFAKIALIVFVAKYCSDNLRSFNNFCSRDGILPLFFGVGLMVFGILIGRDFGTALLAGSVAVFIMIAAGLRLRYWLIPLGVFILIALYIVLLDQMRLWRILSFLEPEKYAQGEGYQLNNSLMALGSGGWFGQGFAASRMKARYLPEAHTDFILSIVGEELGLFGMILVLIGYGFLAYYAVKISLNSTTRLGMLLGSGLSFVIICQALINITVISGMAPTKGMPAPFISYGGSNIMMCFIAVGLLFSIARETIKGAKNTAVPPRDEG